jgi:hypothetical protein
MTYEEACVVVRKEDEEIRALLTGDPDRLWNALRTLLSVAETATYLPEQNRTRKAAILRAARDAISWPRDDEDALGKLRAVSGLDLEELERPR